MPSRVISSPNKRLFSTSGSLVRQQSQPSLQPGRPTVSLTRATKKHTASIPSLYQRSSLHTSAIRRADVEATPSILDSRAAAAIQTQLPSESVQTQAPATISTTVEVQEAQSSSEQPLVISKSLQTLLPHLVAQKPHYITTHIHSFPYLLTEGDTLRLPFHMHGVNPGDVLRFNRATIIGSRDFTLKAGFSSPQHTSPSHVRGEAYTNKRRTGEPNYVDERLFECRMRVMALDSSPMMVVEKKKRRIRRTRKVMSKHKYTVLKVMEVRIKSLEELKSTPGQQVLLE